MQRTNLLFVRSALRAGEVDSGGAAIAQMPPCANTNE